MYSTLRNSRDFCMGEKASRSVAGEGANNKMALAVDRHLTDPTRAADRSATATASEGPAHFVGAQARGSRLAGGHHAA
jgi:hypothetical protein